VFRMLSLLMLAGILVSLAGISWFWKNPLPSAVDRPVARWQPELSANVAVDDLVDPLHKKENTFLRPVFSPTRRPFVAPIVSTQQVQPEQVVVQPQSQTLTDSSLFQLKGILLSDSRTAALIVTPENADGKWYSNTDNVMGWKISKINANSVELMANGQSKTIQQYVDNSQLPLGTGNSPN
jgi:type II secretory pathway component PulC